MTLRDGWPTRRTLKLLMLVSAATLAAASAGCSGPLEANERLTSADLQCGVAIDRLDQLPAMYATVLDVLALPTVDTHQRGRTDDDNRRFSKMGLLVRTGASFEMRVASNSRPNAAIAWGLGGGDPVDVIDVDGCAGAPAWLVFAGGVWVHEDGCIELVVHRDEESAVISLPIGTTCNQ